jgi:hypothetical protein
MFIQKCLVSPTCIHRTRLGFREARLSETGLPRITGVGNSVNRTGELLLQTRDSVN